MKVFVRWCLSGLLTLVVVFSLLFLFARVLDPLKDWIAMLVSGYMDKRPDTVTALPEPKIPRECTFAFSGTVKQNDGFPVINAEISIYDAGLYGMGELRYTNAQGRFSYTEMGTDVCARTQLMLLIRKKGFQPVMQTVQADEDLQIALRSIY